MKACSRTIRLRFKIWLFCACATFSAFQPVAVAADPVVGITAVSSKATKDYSRTRLADGSYQSELYAFGEGGYWGSQLSDVSIDKLKFLDIARVIAPPLAAKNYLPSKDPNKTTLLIMVYWGTTTVPPPVEDDPLYQNYQQAISQSGILLSQRSGEPQAVQDILTDEANSVLTAGLRQLSVANHDRDVLDFKNASMLGYDADGLIGTEFGKNVEHTALGTTYKDEVSEIEDNRYFVVLMAYDFQLLWKKRQHKLLWETRFSINERHNHFDAALPAMAAAASKYFGENTKGLVRKEVREGQVNIGEVKSLGEVSPPGK